MKNPWKIAFIISLALFSLGGIFFYQQARLNDGKLHVVFCNVGQGDAIFIRTPKGLDILVDGGPELSSVLSCLSNHMPFWDRTIEVVALTHPHADHLVGLISVLKRYKVGSFITEKLENKTQSFRELMKIVEDKKISVRYGFAGDRLITKDGVVFQVLSPSEEFLQRTSPSGVIGESGEFASLILLVSYGEFDILLTGDSQITGLEEALGVQPLSQLEVFQVAHHGSKTGLSEEVLSEVRPRLAVISVGKNNKYGHPHKEVIEILRDKDIKILRTDLDGEVEIISDGKGWGLVDH
ncbi:MAG: MBL fold metallo-hydrolase [Candidatus Levybacteria bacterium]|nr:MBL fold metallo-hydrolase [Candidatus Levybacteria bacterium]MBI2190119.1 MBL fold metallo-hydrolase [Candidatus Levybacteria bacterium]MBI3070180.1 MBL fold metallo-hydrolase [Candidatus Levybacteria bacterium]MBI3092899.1 MBL fold metallo-hydrolase [Candidatus Levybacteria bacterium]